MKTTLALATSCTQVRTTMRHLRSTSLLLLAATALATPLIADGRTPGSLMVFPHFRHNAGATPPGRNTLITVTNTHPTEDVFVHFVFVSGVQTTPNAPCAKIIDRTRFLSESDTFTLLTNPFATTNAAEGYAYAFAVNAQNGPWNMISFNHLIADVVILDGVLIGTNYSANPAAFSAVNTTLNAVISAAPAINPVPVLNGVMYQSAPERILIPRFMGQSTDHDSSLVLLSLAGSGTTTGSSNQFETIVDFLVFNDNEEAFSAQHAFRCWNKIRLVDLNGIFTTAFLGTNTNDDADEIVGAPTFEAGWMWLQGNVASSSSTDIPNPAILAFLVETTDGPSNTSDAESAAELPFFFGTRTGRLSP